MGKLESILTTILRGTSDSNISFSDLMYVCEALGFVVRIKGDHFIYTKQETELAQLQRQTAVFQTARMAYTTALAKALEAPAHESDSKVAE